MKKGTTLKVHGNIPEPIKEEYNATMIEVADEITVLEKVQQKKARLIVTKKGNSEKEETFTGFIKVDGKIFPCTGNKKIDEKNYFINIE